MAWYDDLNEPQRDAVGSPCPNVAVVAGPGTGKTRTLLNKAAQLIEEEVTSPSAIRIVSFTNAGVYDLRKKLQSLPAYSAVPPEIVTTFHSLALRTLRRASVPTVPSPLTVLDDWEEATYIDQFAKVRLGLTDIRRARRVREDYNSRWCIASETADAWLSEGDRQRYEAVYNLAKDLLGFTTRGELTFLWWRHLRANPGATRAALGLPWTHLLVDEYQDLNECEHDVLQQLSRAGVSVFAVGDPNQSIYETMRHAHPEFCWDFPNRVTPGELRLLKESYRCRGGILSLGQALLGVEEGIPDPALAQPGGEWHIIAFPSDSGERSGLARLAVELLRRNPDCRILLAVPSRGIAKAFAEELTSVPFDNRTTREEEDPEECRLASALLRLLREPNDSVSAATAIILNCARSTRPARVADLLEVSERAGMRVAEVLAGNTPLPTPLAKARQKANDMLEALRNAASELPETIRELTGCVGPVGDATELEARIEEILARSEQLEPGKVTIMTLHGSKGTEAEWVIIPAREPGFFERDLVGAPKEERRRLLYVGATRAVEGLFLTFARVRYGPQRYSDPTGASSRKGPSVFIDEICDRTGRAPEPAADFLQAWLGGTGSD